MTHLLAQQVWDAGFQPNLTALLDSILTEGVHEAQERYETNKDGLRSMSRRITARMKDTGLDEELVKKVEQALSYAFYPGPEFVTIGGRPHKLR